MKKSELTRFKDFKRKYNLTEKLIVQIMTQYADTEDQYSASFFAAKYQITERVFYLMRDFTIIFMLVDAPICRRIRDKTFRNQSGKNQSGNFTAANRHYQLLIEKRKEYLKSFSDEEIELIAIEYANGDALYDIAKKHNISVYTVRKLLAIALVNKLVCEPIYHAIRFRSSVYIGNLGYYRGYTAEDLWHKYSHWEWKTTAVPNTALSRAFHPKKTKVYRLPFRVVNKLMSQYL